jgi:hypothetical protein
MLPRYSTDDRGGRRLVCRPLAGVRAGRLVEAVLRTSTAERPAVATVLDALRAEAAAITARRSSRRPRERARDQRGDGVLHGAGQVEAEIGEGGVGLVGSERARGGPGMRP